MPAYLRHFFSWKENASPLVLLALALAIGGTWMFIELADEVVEGDSRQFDEWVLTSLRLPDDPSRPRGPTWLAEAMRDITALGSTAVLVLTVLAVVGYLILVHRYATVWLCIGATLGGLLVGSVMKHAFARPRPSVVPHLTDVLTASFPSGHSMYSTVVYLTLGTLLTRVAPEWRTKLYIISVSVVLILLIGISRVYLGVHYPTDVLAGWMAGLAWALFCWLLARHLQRRGAVEAERESANE